MKKYYCSVIVFLISTFPLFALASAYVQCGDAVDLASGKVTGYELELSSERDDFNGPVGKNWNLKLQEDGNWLEFNKSINARTSLDANGNAIVQITIAIGKSTSGPVGTRYVLTGLYNEEPILEKYTMGGFAGSVKTNTLKCQSGND